MRPFYTRAKQPNIALEPSAPMDAQRRGSARTMAGSSLVDLFQRWDLIELLAGFHLRPVRCQFCPVCLDRNSRAA